MSPAPSRICLLGLIVLAACRRPQAERRVPADTAVRPPVADAPAPGPRACDLLAADDIRHVTQVRVQPGVSTNDYAGDSQCKFANADSSAGGVMVALHEHGSIENYRRVPGSTAVPDVGDAAVWNSGTGQLAVASGAAVFSISFLNPPAKREWAVQLAMVSLAALPRK